MRGRFGSIPRANDTWCLRTYPQVIHRLSTGEFRCEKATNQKDLVDNMVTLIVVDHSSEVHSDSLIDHSSENTSSDAYSEKSSSIVESIVVSSEAQ